MFLHIIISWGAHHSDTMKRSWHLFDSIFISTKLRSKPIRIHITRVELAFSSTHVEVIYQCWIWGWHQGKLLPPSVFYAGRLWYRQSLLFRPYKPRFHFSWQCKLGGVHQPYRREFRSRPRLKQLDGPVKDLLVQKEIPISFRNRNYLSRRWAQEYNMHTWSPLTLMSSFKRSTTKNCFLSL